MNNGPRGPSKRMSPSVDPESLAIEALTFIASDPDHAARFMALSGIGLGDLRQAATNPGFLLGVMDHVIADEALLLLVAASAGIAPEAVVLAHEHLSRPRNRIS